MKKEEVRKMSLLVALKQFHEEIADLKISSSDKQRAMQEFKQAFERSLDYDLAVDRVIPKLAPEFKSRTFKSFWDVLNGSTDIRKGFFSTEESKLRNAIADGFKEGLTEVAVINALILNASNFFKRPPTQDEIDKLRYFVISEKIKLRSKGVEVNG